MADKYKRCFNCVHYVPKVDAKDGFSSFGYCYGFKKVLSAHEDCCCERFSDCIQLDLFD